MSYMLPMEYIKSKIKKTLDYGGFTISAPLLIDPAIECHSLLSLNNSVYNITINAHYIYLKDGVPYVANDKYDEVLLEDLQKESIEKIAYTLGRTVKEKN